MRIRGKFLAATALILAAGLSTATGPAASATVAYIRQAVAYISAT